MDYETLNQTLRNSYRLKFRESYNGISLDYGKRPASYNEYSSAMDNIKFLKPEFEI